MTTVSAKASVPPPDGSSAFLFDHWDEIRNRALTPVSVSDLAASDQDRQEYLAGATLLGLVGERRFPWAVNTPTQLLTVDVMAAGHFQNAFLLPRRSTKSTALIALAVGRAMSRPGYRAGILTMTTGKAGRSRFVKDVLPALDRTMPDKEARDFRVVLAAGQERIVFEHPEGDESFIQWLSTENDLRGEAFDLVILDEAQAAQPGKVEEVMAAALPATITRAGAQVAVAGTGGAFRTGNLLWQWREEAEGKLIYEADQDLTIDEIDTWDKAKPILEATHPGIGVNTSIEVLKVVYNSMSRQAFLVEFLNVFPKTALEGFLNIVQWEAGALTGKAPTPPSRFGLGFSVNLLSSSAAIVAAWRDDEGHAVFGVLAHAAGSKWAGPKARKFALEYKQPITYDSAVSSVAVEIEPLLRLNPKPKLDPRKWPDVANAAALLKNEIDAGNVRHWQHAGLDVAIVRAKKRGTPDSQRWAFGRLAPEDDITPLEAAALALYAYDDAKPKRPFVGHLQT